MTEKLVKKAKEYDRDTIPGDCATLAAPCPNCGGVVKETTAIRLHRGGTGLRLLVSGSRLPGAPLRSPRPSNSARAPHRPAGGLSFQGRLALRGRGGHGARRRGGQLQARIDFGDDKNAENRASWVDFAGQEGLGPAPACTRPSGELRRQLRLQKAVPLRAKQPRRRATSRAADHPTAAGGARQMKKLLDGQRPDLLDKFVSMRTPRQLKAFLAWDKETDKVGFPKFERRNQATARKTAAAKTGAASAAGGRWGRKTLRPQKAAAKPRPPRPAQDQRRRQVRPPAPPWPPWSGRARGPPGGREEAGTTSRPTTCKTQQDNAPSPTTSCAPCPARTASACSS